jgi:hypothetical protein
MQLNEIIQALKFAPAEKKLEALRHVNLAPSGTFVLSDLQDSLEKLASVDEKTAVRFYALRALAILGDNRTLLVYRLMPFISKRIFTDAEDHLIPFPWVPQNLDFGSGSLTENPLSWTGYTLERSVEFAVAEAVSWIRNNDSAAKAMKQMLDLPCDSSTQSMSRVVYICSLGAIGHESSKELLSYYATSLSESPEGKAAATALKNFGTMSFYDLIRAQQPEKPKEKDGCFIISAVAGDSNCFEVRVFRVFRDEVLLISPVGRFLVRAYYRLSPRIAKFIENHPGLRRVLFTFFVSRLAARFAKLGLLRAGRDQQRLSG